MNERKKETKKKRVRKKAKEETKQERNEVWLSDRKSYTRIYKTLAAHPFLPHLSSTKQTNAFSLFTLFINNKTQKLYCTV